MIAALADRTPFDDQSFWANTSRLCLSNFLDDLLSLMIRQGFIPYYSEDLPHRTKWINDRVQFNYNAFLQRITLFDLEKLRIKDLLQ